jgi:four helix bundle protein
MYALTGQVRRSSRAVCANLAEGYGKRRYRPHFLLKLSDALAENNETICWLDIANHAHYIETESHESLSQQASEIGNLIAFMIHHPEKFMHQDLSS